MARLHFSHGGTQADSAVNAAPASLPATPQTFRELMSGFPAFLRKSVPTVISSAFVAGVVGYISNIWLMAVKYDGTNDIPKGTPATSDGNFVGGAMFWALASAVVFGIGAYAKGVGFKKFFAEMRSLPRVLAGMVRRDGAAGRIHLLWGACAALLAGLVLPPATGALLAVGFLAAAPTVLGNMISNIAGKIFSGILKPISPNRARVVGIEAMMVGLIGSSLALAATFVIPDRTLRLVLAVVCGGLAVMMSQRLRPPTAVSSVVVLVGVVGAYALVAAARAKADDGSFAECGNDIARWLSECGGADKIRKQGLVGAVAAALGAPPGAFVGKVVAEVAKELGGGRGVFPKADLDSGPRSGSGSRPVEGHEESDAKKAVPGLGIQEQGHGQDGSQPPPRPFPTGPEIDKRLADLNRYNPNATPEDHMRAIDDFMDHIRKNKGFFTPDDLRTLEQLEGKDASIGAKRHEEIVTKQEQQGREWLDERKRQLEAEAKKERDLAATLKDLDRQTDFTRKHVDDLPGGQDDAVGRILEQIDEKVGEMRRTGKALDPVEQKKLEDMIKGVNHAIGNSNAGRSEAEFADAAEQAEREAEKERAYRRMQTAIGAAAAATGVGLVVAGVVAGAGAAGATVVFGSTFTSAQVGAGLWGLGGISGAVTGGREGESLLGHEVGPGMLGAVAGATRAMLPVNIASTIADELKTKGNQAPVWIGDLFPRSVGELVHNTLNGGPKIILATIQDLGNVGGLGDAADTMRGMRPASGPRVSDDRIRAGAAEKDALDEATKAAKAAGSEAPKGPPKTFTGADSPVPGARDANVKQTWDALNADGHGRIFGPDGKQVAEVLPDGRIRSTVTELAADGKPRLASNEPINPDTVKFGPDGKMTGYELPDGRTVDLHGPDGKPVIKTTGADGVESATSAQGTRGRPGSLEPEVAKKWDSVRAGPDGELYGADGRVIGKIDKTGNMVDVNGREITDIGSMKGGRVDEFTVNQPRGTDAAEPVTMRTRQENTGPKPSREIEFKAADGTTQKGTVPLADDTGVRGLRPGEEIPKNNLHEIGATTNQVDEAGRVAREGYTGADGKRVPVEIEARTTNPESMRHIRDGTATPKPLDVKTKTINPIDTMLGAKPGDVGKVGFFEPKLPENLNTLPPKLQEDVLARFNQRNAEIGAHGPHILELEQKGFLQRSPDGTLIAGPDYPVASARGKPFAGDIDMVSIREHATGKPLSPQAYDEVVNNARNSGMQAQHGAEQYSRGDLEKLGWKTDDIDKLYKSLEGAHQTGAEVTWRIGPDGIPRRGSRLSEL